jgi:hypothetical protein
VTRGQHKRVDLHRRLRRFVSAWKEAVWAWLVKKEWLRPAKLAGSVLIDRIKEALPCARGITRNMDTGLAPAEHASAMFVQNNQFIRSRLDAGIKMSTRHGLVVALVFDWQLYYPLLGVNVRIRKLRVDEAVRTHDWRTYFVAFYIGERQKKADAKGISVNVLPREGFSRH